VFPGTLYFGIEGLYSGGCNTFKNRETDFKNNETIERTKSHTTWYQIEERMGYTFQSPLARALLIPFIGLGCNGIHLKHEGSSDVSYAALGFRIEHQFTKAFFTGCYVKALYNFHKRQSVSGLGSFCDKSHDWGYEVEIPLRFQLDRSGTWDLQLQPYILKLSASEGTTGIGSRVVIGYTI